MSRCARGKSKRRVLRCPPEIGAANDQRGGIHPIAQIPRTGSRRCNRAGVEKFNFASRNGVPTRNSMPNRIRANSLKTNDRRACYPKLKPGGLRTRLRRIFSPKNDLRRIVKSSAGRFLAAIGTFPFCPCRRLRTARRIRRRRPARVLRWRRFWRGAAWCC